MLKEINMKTIEIALHQIKTNPNQPRREFDESAIYGLAQSIQENGLIQPIVVRPVGTHYEIVAGERRFRAMQILKADTVSAIVVNVTDNQADNMSLIENIQRMDLSAIEEALAYQALLANQKITQETLAMRLGKSQPSIANKLRLLNLNPEVQAAILNKQITERHGRSLLSLDLEQQSKVLKKIITNDLNVSQSEKLVDGLKTPKTKKPNKANGRTKQIQLGINTVNETVELIRSSGLNVNCEIVESEVSVVMSIVFKK
jgi:ParB family transcriptional regulator, chromosome partitioning protein